MSGNIFHRAYSAIATHRADFRPARFWLLLGMLAIADSAQEPTLHGAPIVPFASAPPRQQPRARAADLTSSIAPPTDDLRQPQNELSPPKPEQIWRAVLSHNGGDPLPDPDRIALLPDRSPSVNTPLEFNPAPLDAGPADSPSDPLVIALPAPIGASPAAPRPVGYIPPPAGPLVGAPLTSIPEPAGLAIASVVLLLIQRPRPSNTRQPPSRPEHRVRQQKSF